MTSNPAVPEPIGGGGEPATASRRRRPRDEERDRVRPFPEAIASPSARTLVDTSRSIDAERRRRAEQAAAARLSQKALRDTSLSELLDDATFTLVDTLGVEESSVLLFEADDTDTLVLVSGYGPIGDQVGARVPTVGSVGGVTLARREPVVHYTGTDDGRFSESAYLARAGIESTIAVAIEGPEHAFGVLAAHSRGLREFTRDDELFVQTVANVVGAAILRDRAELALVEAEEAERRRIAEAVHDDTLQVMIAVALRLETLQRETPDPGTKDKIHELAVETRAAATRLRSLAFDLFPEDLSTGVDGAIRRLLEDTARHAGFTFTLQADLPRTPPKAAARTIYRNAQEAIVNVGKHAGASHVQVTVATEGEGTRVRIADDGVGISPRAAAAGVRGHLGIKTLRDRTVRCGGHVRIEPGSGGGTVVDFWIPDSARRPEPTSGVA